MKLIHGEALEILSKIESESINCIVTDPPYKTTSRGCAGNSGGMLQKDINKKGQVFVHNDIEINDWLPECYRILKEGSHMYIMTNNKNLHNYLNIIKKCGFNFIKSLIWVKDNKIMGQYYMGQFEYVLFIRKGKGIKINNCGTSDVLNFKNIKLKDKDNKNLHDTEKPIGLNEIIIANSTKEGDIVLDPFMGIGSCGIACKNTNRDFIGIELDENYFNIAKDRIMSS